MQADFCNSPKQSKTCKGRDERCQGTLDGKMSEARTEDVLSWTDTNDFPRAEGEGSGKWI